MPTDRPEDLGGVGEDSETATKLSQPIFLYPIHLDSIVRVSRRHRADNLGTFRDIEPNHGRFFNRIPCYINVSSSTFHVELILAGRQLMSQSCSVQNILKASLRFYENLTKKIHLSQGTDMEDPKVSKDVVLEDSGVRFIFHRRRRTSPFEKNIVRHVRVLCDHISAYLLVRLFCDRKQVPDLGETRAS